MPSSIADTLKWIDSQQHGMISLLKSWAEINSESSNLAGLASMLKAIEMRFAALQGKSERIDLPPRMVISPRGEKTAVSHGQALRITKRPEASLQIFLGGHMDTVYTPDHPFQQVEQIEEHILKGPGVVDMKGGLIVMLTALEALERHPAAANIGWEVLINPDEEVGSVGSESLLLEAAKRNHLGLLFEPAYPDGAVVSSRKGSANISVFARGKPAHVGRDFDKGQNAVVALADFAVRASSLTNTKKDITVNIGQLTGGGPFNIVPDAALCRVNLRTLTSNDFTASLKRLQEMCFHSIVEGVSLSLLAYHARPPKPFDNNAKQLYHWLADCAKEEGFELKARPSGGVCDGNILATAGLPVIDSLGAVGGGMHTPAEFVILDSLVQRSRLAALFLLKLAMGVYDHQTLK